MSKHEAIKIAFELLLRWQGSSYHASKVNGPWPSWKGHKVYNKVNIKLMWDIDVENKETLPIEFWKDP